MMDTVLIFCFSFCYSCVLSQIETYKAPLSLPSPRKAGRGWPQAGRGVRNLASNRIGMEYGLYAVRDYPLTASMRRDRRRVRGPGLQLCRPRALTRRGPA